MDESYKKLQKIKSNLKDIGYFSVEDRVKISKESQEVDRRIMIGNEKIKAYQLVKKMKGNSDETTAMALDIQFENIQILNEKFKVVQTLIQDMYGRVELLGNSVRHVASEVQELILKDQSGDVECPQ